MNLDFIKITQLLIDLFKKKTNNPDNPYPASNYDPIPIASYYRLFETHDYVNYNLLFNELKISQDSATVFFKYCHSKKLSQALLSEENQIIFLDSIVQLSKEFIAESKTKD